jgi:hypothetical protein
MALHLEQLENSHLIVGIKGTNRMIDKKGLPGFVGTIEDNANVVVASDPRIANIFLEARFENRSQLVTEPVKRGSQRSTPLLVPRMTARIASAVAAPTLDSMDTTPGAVFHDLDVMPRRMLFEKFSVVCKLRDSALVDFVEGITQSHFAIVMVVAITLAIGRDVDELVALTCVGKATQKAIGETFAVIQ